MRNLTGSGANRIVKRERGRQKWVPVLRPAALQISGWRMILSPNRLHFGGSCAGPSKADIVSEIDEQPTTATPRPLPSRRLGLSGKLLLLTIPLIMIAGMLIYVPAIANFRMNRLNDRLAAANTPALGLDAPP